MQNLFYLNNVVHDILYRHGFNEAAGNFQVDNFGKGGAGADAVRAEAQDGSGTDNANFATPPDGRKPRMQMYLWTGAGFTHSVKITMPVAVSYGAMGAEFGPALTSSGLSGAIVRRIAGRRLRSHRSRSRRQDRPRRSRQLRLHREGQERADSPARPASSSPTTSTAPRPSRWAARTRRSRSRRS